MIAAVVLILLGLAFMLVSLPKGYTWAFIAGLLLVIVGVDRIDHKMHAPIKIEVQK